MKIRDAEHDYPLLCVLRGHRWWREPYTIEWHRDASCHRCEHILQGVEAARARWIKHNAAAKAQGCKCGAPATVVRRYGGTVEGVPCEVWTCEEHRNVNSWSRLEGQWVPSGDYDDAALAWEVS